MLTALSIFFILGVVLVVVVSGYENYEHGHSLLWSVFEAMMPIWIIMVVIGIGLLMEAIT